ncbi:sugar/nucleoside kinase (ribokinase family) [Spinactinospora alkalitolerans]|uniref:Sugar/nucleoside kinase (Ribokinase family) n=1 Tax=Spinactinospora alkalitolerans TaxID=687207 RepID=A0A852U180_9ACTN|nr:carbohydrate kinase family protein [Spinactinospora alkalitolerans]NYE49978.1 sugar/nucleoside kinase (ribokinase family) [Spinactinospora alkalitolerans]
MATKGRANGGAAADPAPEYDKLESTPLVGEPRDVLAGAREPDSPTIDLALSGTVFFDIVLTGLAAPPAGGTEVDAEGMGSCPGGVANLAVAASRLGLRTAVAAAFGEDVYGDFSWDTLAGQEMVDLSASRRFPEWHSPFTVSLAYRGDRSMVTHEHPSPVPLREMACDLPQARAAFVSLSADGDVPEWALRQAGNGAKLFADVGWDVREEWSSSVLEQLRHCHAFVPNAIEAMSYTRTGSPASALSALSEHVPVAVVTDGPRGALAVDQTTGESAEVEGLVLEAIDTTGAGDVFGAAFIVGTLACWPLEQRLRFANLCAALSVQHTGGSLSAPGWADIAAWWGRLHVPHCEAERRLAEDYRFLSELVPMPWLPTAQRRASATIGLRH